MNKRIKVIDFFKVLVCIIFLTLILSIITIRKIENTNVNNNSIEEQTTVIEKYVSNNQTANNVKLLLNEILEYSEDKFEDSEKIPTIEFYGKENYNKILIYTVNDKVQFNYYRSEIDELKKLINEDDSFFVKCEADGGYIDKIIIEYNY